MRDVVPVQLVVRVGVLGAEDERLDNDRHGLHVMLALSSYPYSEPTTGRVDRTMPYAQTLEAGFKNEDWTDPAREPFGSQYRRYLEGFVGLFRDETAVFSWSSSGAL